MKALYNVLIIFFMISIGCPNDKEIEEYEFVEWAELNYIVEINPWP